MALDQVERGPGLSWGGRRPKGGGFWKGKRQKLGEPCSALLGSVCHLCICAPDLSGVLRLLISPESLISPQASCSVSPGFGTGNGAQPGATPEL